MDNMGGLRGLWYIDAEDYVSLVEGGNDTYTLTLKNGAIINPIAFTHDTGKISESEEETDNGTVYNFEASCRIPKCGADNTALMGDLRKKKIMIMGEDNNGKFLLAGSPGSYFNIGVGSSTGESTQDVNARQLKISAALPEGCVFISSPL